MAIIVALSRGLILQTSPRAYERFAAHACYPLGGRTGLQNRLGMDEGRGRGGSLARVLIVNDEPDIRFMMRLILEGAGYSVTEARHGAAGLKSAKASHPALVTTDGIPILVVSGNSELGAGANARLPNPFTRRELLHAAALLIREDGG